MAIENTDLLLVNDGNKSYKIEYSEIKDDIKDEVKGEITTLPEAPDDGTQYGRQKIGQDMEWTPIVHTPAYGDSDVDDHLGDPENTATAGQVLSWDGSDYDWVDNQGGSGTVPGDYTYPGGQNRTLQSRLEDYVSVKDFGAKGDGANDDTSFIQAALQNGGAVYFPEGVYRITSPLVINDKSVSIRGAGPKSIILCQAAATSSDAWLHFKYSSGGNSGSRFQLMDIDIHCDRFATIDTAVRIECTAPDGASASQPNIVGGFNSLNIDNVQINTHEPAFKTGYFKRGLHILNAGGVVTDNFKVAIGFIEGEDDADTIGIHIQNTKRNFKMIRTLTMTNFYIERFNKALYAEKTSITGDVNIESCYLTQGEVLSKTGLHFQNIHATSITSSHIQTLALAINIDCDGGPHRIIGNDIRCYRTGLGNNYAIRLGCPNITFASNYVESISPELGAIELHNTLYTGLIKPTNIVISGNVFKGDVTKQNTRAIIAKSDASEVFCASNEFYNYYMPRPFYDESGDSLYLSNQSIHTQDGSTADQLYSNKGHLYNCTPLPGIDNTRTGAHIQISDEGANFHVSHNNNVGGNYNRNSDGDILAFRRSGNTKGAIQVTGSGIVISGLAGTNPFSSGFNLDTSEGIIQALKNVLSRLEQLESN